jgi:hypothetical protein
MYGTAHAAAVSRTSPVRRTVIFFIWVVVFMRGPPDRVVDRFLATSQWLTGSQIVNQGDNEDRCRQLEQRVSYQSMTNSDCGSKNSTGRVLILTGKRAGTSQAFSFHFWPLRGSKSHIL